MWLFTTQKFEGRRPFTVQANYEGFAEGMNETCSLSSVHGKGKGLPNSLFGRHCCGR